MLVQDMPPQKTAFFVVDGRRWRSSDPPVNRDLAVRMMERGDLQIFAAAGRRQEPDGGRAPLSAEGLIIPQWPGGISRSSKHPTTHRDESSSTSCSSTRLCNPSNQDTFARGEDR